MGQHLQLEDLLVSLNAEGQRDSSGAFTLDERSALERLANFKLADPHQYCLRWLQAAVAGAASYFNWSCDQHGCRAEFGGYLIEPNRIHQLPIVMLDGQARRAERHLSAGLNAVLRSYARVIRLRSGNHEGRWTRGQFEIVRKELGMDSTKIEVEFVPQGSVFQRLFEPPERKEPEMIHSQACVPLSLSVCSCPPRRRIDGLSDYYGAKIREFWVPAERPYGFLPPPFRLETNYTRSRIYIARLLSQREGPSFFYGVRDGVWLQPRPISDVSNVVAFADVSQLQADLTGLQIVEEGAYQELRSEVLRAIFKVM